MELLITSLEPKYYPLILETFRSTLPREDQEKFVSLLRLWVNENKKGNPISSAETQAYNKFLNLYLFKNCFSQWSNLKKGN